MENKAVSVSVPVPVGIVSASCQPDKAARPRHPRPPIVLVIVIVLVFLPLFEPARARSRPFGERTALALEPIPELLAALIKIIKQQLHLPVLLRPGRVWMDFTIVPNLFRNGCFQA